MITLRGTNGAVSINVDRPGLRVGDITLSTRNESWDSSLSEFCLRDPFSGGGITSHAHEALRQFAKPATPQPGLRLDRRRNPLVLLGDDGDSNTEGMTYLEISSDEQGFLLEVRNIGPITTGSGPIRVNDPEQMQHLANLYQAVEREQASQKERIQKQFQKKSGIVYDPLRIGEWEEEKQDCQEYAQMGASKPGATKSADEIYAKLHEDSFARIRDIGIFLIKSGAGLPKEINDEWHQEFKDHPDVKAIAGRSL